MSIAAAGLAIAASAALPVVTASAGLQTQLLSPPDAAPNDEFGSAVDIDGDVLVVGARYKDEGDLVGAGAAYVYTRNGPSWELTTQLLSGKQDGFGASVAVSGDTILVGAPDARNNKGDAYVFVRNGNGWDQQTILRPAVDTTRAQFGSKVALDGDTAVVAAPEYKDGARVGGVYVFDRTGATWDEKTVLVPVGVHRDDDFAASVALDGDIVVAGAPRDVRPNNQSGTAYVFARSEGTWTEEARLLPADSPRWFAEHVAVDGSLIAVSGGDVVHFYDPSRGSWDPFSKIKTNLPGTIDLAGRTAVVGIGVRKAAVFELTGDQWSRVDELEPLDTSALKEFADSVAIQGTTVVVTDPEQNAAGRASGVVYVFRTGDICDPEAATILGTDGDDSIAGTPGPDIIVALGGHDVIEPGAGDDVVCAGPGNDLVIDGLGSNTLIGDRGWDTVSYENAPAGVTIDLAAGTATGDSVEDRLDGFEHATGSAFNDSITGTDRRNTLRGLGGNDRLAGLGGDDRLLGDDGNDTLIGGLGDDLLRGNRGTDRASYQTSVTGVIVDLLAGEATGEGVDTIRGVENATGSKKPDTLLGTHGKNKLFGFHGDDVLDGRGGADVLDGGTRNDLLIGGTGQDQLIGGSGNDTLAGGPGADVLDGGDGNNWLSFQLAAGPVTVKLATNVAKGEGNDSLDNFVHIIGSIHNDRLVGNQDANTILGGPGDDTIIGKGGHDELLGFTGDDTLKGGDGRDGMAGEDGNDTIVGGPGRDFVSFEFSSHAVDVDLSEGIATGEGNDRISAVEDVVGTRHPDIITGSGTNNTLLGWLGDDRLFGRGGNDLLLGDAGNDTLNGQAGNDQLDGGPGTDALNGGAGSDECHNGESNSGCESIFRNATALTPGSWLTQIGVDPRWRNQHHPD